MKKIVLVFTIWLFSALGCIKNSCGCDPVSPLDKIKATVIQTSTIDCKRPLIKIDAGDAVKVQQLLDFPVGTHSYIADQLPVGLLEENKTIWVSLADLPPSEDFACTTLGPSYHHIKIMHAWSR